MRLGYNTNGFQAHRLLDAIDILAGIGYRCVAITLDHHALNPLGETIAQDVTDVRERLRHHRLDSVIETGARFLLDPRRKHQPTLVSPTSGERNRRLDLLRRAVDLAAQLESEAVSFWSGSLVDDATEAEAMARLVDGCRTLCAHADAAGVRVAFEPEPGMLIETMDQFARLVEAVGHPRFGLTLDVGHIHCLGDGEIRQRIEAWHERLVNIHIEDMRRGHHDHLPFGEGEMDIPSILAALDRVGYTGPVNVELSRHSHDAVRVAKHAFEFLTSALGR